MTSNNHRKTIGQPTHVDITEASHVGKRYWVSTASRAAGRLARQVATRLDAVASTLAAQVRPHPVSPAQIDSLLGQLGRLVQSSAGAYGPLRDSDDFWKLIVQIAAWHRTFGRYPACQTEVVRQEVLWTARAQEAGKQS